MTTYTPEEARKLAHRFLTRAKSRLDKKLTLRTEMYLIVGRGPRAVTVNVPIPDELWNYNRSTFYWLVGDFARAHRADVVAQVSDAWSLDHTDEQLKRQKRDPSIQERIDSIGTQAAAREGLGQLIEVIFVSVQTPEFHVVLRQTYERRGDRIVYGRLEDVDSTMGEMKGPMVVW